MHYENKTYSEERSLYHIVDGKVINCRFEGELDGESPLKECNNIEVSNCYFNLRYPFWHNKNVTINNCVLHDNSRAPLWYCNDVKIVSLNCNSVKAVRECKNINIYDSHFISEEFGWKSNNLSLVNSSFVGPYFLFDSKNVSLVNCKLTGKYSFQYIDNLTIENSYLDTKDAFWHSKNVVVINSVLKGEYIGWYSKNVSLINCKIIGTQPFCYCKKLKIINCEFVDADLAFENSEVNATIVGHIDSIKNPLKGKIVVDDVNEIIIQDYVNKPKCKVIVNKQN